MFAPSSTPPFSDALTEDPLLYWYRSLMCMLLSRRFRFDITRASITNTVCYKPLAIYN